MPPIKKPPKNIPQQTVTIQQPKPVPIDIRNPPDVKPSEYYQQHYANYYNSLTPDMQKNYISPKKALERQLGYAPNFGQDPRQVADAYAILKATPKDISLPTWMQGQEKAIEQAYNWHSFRNGGKPPTDWKYLPGDDPALAYLESLQGPPEAQPPGEASPFAPPKAVQQGEAAWDDMSTEQRKVLLQNPQFDITAYPVETRDQILKDPNFNWSRVPKWQKTYYELMSNPKIMASPMALAGAHAGGIFGVPGRIVGAAAGYGLGLIGGQEYDPTGGVLDQPTTAAGMMAVLNKLSEGAEQSAGFATQYLDAAIAGMQGNEQAAEAAKRMLTDEATRKATWEAGRLTYEVSDFLGARNWIPAIALIMAVSDTQGVRSIEDIKAVAKRENIQFAQGGEDFILGQAAPVERATATAINPITGNRYRVTDSAELLREARLTIHDAIIKGEDPRVVVRQLLGEHSQYVGAQIADFAGQAAIDPLELLPEATNTLNFSIAKVMGNETAARAFMETNAPFEAARRYKTLVQTGDVAPGFSYEQMGPVSRWIAGINSKNQIKAGPLTDTGLLDVPAKRTGLLSKLKEDWAALTPESRAREGASMFYNNIGTLLSSMADPHEIGKMIRSVSNGDMKLWSEMAGKVAASPEWYTILPALKDFKIEKLDGLIQAWDLTAPKRDMLMRISNVLGEDPGKLIEDLAKRGTPDQDMQRLTQRLQAAGEDGADLLREIEAGRFTADHLQDIVGAFTGTGALHWHPDQWKASLMDALGSHFDEWTAERLGLGKDTPESKAFFRTTHLLKSAQSVLLLGGSPGYALQNGLSNMVHRAATGIYGYMTPHQIDSWLTRFGVEPARLSEGVGIGGAVDMAPTRGSVQTSAIDMAIRGDQRGPLGAAQRIVSNIGKAMPFNKVSSWFESTESKHGTMIAMKDIWAKTWRRGVGFQEMSPQLRTQVEQAGINPNTIYSLIEAGMNKPEIDRFIFGRQQGMMSRTLINEAAQKVGIPSSQAATLLEKVGVLDALDHALTKAQTPDQVRGAFKMAAQHARDYNDMQTARDLRAMAENVTNKVELEGAPAALDTVMQVNSKYTDAWLDHYYRFGEIFQDLADVPDTALKNRAIEEAYRISSEEFRRINARTAANYLGIFEAWGKSNDPSARGLLAAIAENDRVMSDAYSFMREQRRSFFETYTGDRAGSIESNKAWAELQKEIDTRFSQAFEAKKANDARIGESLTTIYTDMHGPAAGEAARKWWKDANRFSDEIVSRERKFRKSLEGMTKDQRAQAKYKYYGQEKVAQIAELERINMEGIRRLERIVRRGTGPTGTAALPSGPTQPGPGPAPSAEGMIDQLRGEYQQTTRPTRENVQAENLTRLEEQRRDVPTLEEERNQLIAEAEQRQAQEQAERATRVSTVWDAAEQFNRVGLPYDRNVLQDRFALIGALKKEAYGGIPDLTGLDDPRLTPERISSILTRRNELKDIEATAAAERAVDTGTGRRSRNDRTIDNNTKLLRAVRNHGGISLALARDLTGDPNPRGMPGAFTRQGIGIDEMARMLADDGYPIDLDNPTDLGGVAQLTAMIQRARSGENIYPMGHNYDPAIERDAAIHYEKVAAEEAADPTTGDGGAFELAAWEQRLNSAVDRGDLATMYETMGELPPEIGNATRHDGTTWNEHISNIADEAAARVEANERNRTIAEAQARAEIAQEQANTAGDAAMTKQLLKEKIIQEMGLPVEQAEAYMTISDAVATWYSNVTGEDQANFYARYYEDIRKAASDEGLLKQTGEAPVWYTKSEQAITAIRQETMTVDQLRGMLQKAGIKAEEMQWTGLNDFLAERTGKITKAEVQEVLDANRMEMTEIVKGGGNEPDPDVVIDAAFDNLNEQHGWRTQAARMSRKGYELDAFVDDEGSLQFGWHDAKAEGDIITSDEMPPGDIQRTAVKMEMTLEREYRYQTQSRRESDSPTKYHSYTLPGDHTNYQEVLFTMPGKRPDTLPATTTMKQTMLNGRQVYQYWDGDQVVGAGPTPMDAHASALEHYRANPPAKYQSSHWDEPNVLAHTRLTDRVDADGKRVLMVEEIQSDWHQAGRQKGYKRELSVDEQAELNFLQDQANNGWEELPENNSYMDLMGEFEKKYRDEQGRQLAWRYELDADEEARYNAARQASEQAEQVAQARLDELQKGTSGVEPAPFQKTWHEMVMKRILRKAADEGYDRVAWTTGEQQADRYNLAKQVDHIDSSMNPDGTYNIDAVKGRQTLLNREGLTPEQLADTIGKDLAEKIVAADHSQAATHRWEGENLKVGGEGMKGFYDQMLPSWVNKYAKKWGAQVSGTQLTKTVEAYRVRRSDGSYVDWEGEVQTYTSRREAAKKAEWFNGTVEPVQLTQEAGTVHSLDVTPEMRQAVMEGQPLFQIQPINRSLTSDETSFYAQALVRQGAKHVGHALQAESTLGARRQIIDAVYKLDPKMAEAVARQNIDLLFQRDPDAYYQTWLEEARASYKPTKRTDWTKRAIETFGATEYDPNSPLTALWLTPEGKLIALEEHGVIAEVMGPGEGAYRGDEFANETGSVHWWVSPDETNIDLVNTVPTAAQLKVIRQILKDHPSDMITFDIRDANGESLVSDRALATPSGINKIAQIAKKVFESNEPSKAIPSMQRAIDEFQFQDMGAAPKGAVQFGPDGIKATILAFERADVSTVIHENAHIYRRVMTDVVARTGNEQVRADLQVIEQWAGVRDGVWHRAAEEKYARAFERYITEGKAPTPALRKAFEAMRDWMLGIYKVITGSAIDVKIAPEVKAAFDRMLGAEDPRASYKKPIDVTSEIAARTEMHLAELRQGTPPSPEMLEQVGIGNIWYTKAEQTITAWRQEVMTIDQLKGVLQKAGIKADEMKWSGLDDLLKTRTGKITKAEVMDVLNTHRIDIKEVKKGKGSTDIDMQEIAERTWEKLETDSGWQLYKQALEEQGFTHDTDPDDPMRQIFTDLDGKVYGLGSMPERARRYANDMSRIYGTTWNFHVEEATRNRTGGATKYQNYTLPGGENYREILYTMPTPPIKAPTELPALAAPRQYGPEDWRVHYNGELLGIGDTETEARTMALESLARNERPGGEVLYKSSHWEEPNVLAHTRLTDRVDADGKRVLMVEEIQSDWHQAGRQKGYRDPEIDRARQAQKAQVDQLGLDYFNIEKDLAYRIMEWNKTDEAKTTWIRARDGTLLYEGTDKKQAFLIKRENAGSYEDFNAAMQYPQDILDDQARAQEIYRQWDAEKVKMEALPETGPISQAPFQKTWHELVMKRILRMAAEEGYERVAWTTGKQQAERYNLSKQVDYIASWRKPDGTYNIEAVKQDRTLLDKQGLTPEQVEEIVGKDLATRIVDSPDTSNEWRDADLEVGGEGMKGFYDKMLPAWADKYGKKWGAQVGETTVGTPELLDLPERHALVTPDVLRRAAEMEPDEVMSDLLRKQADFVEDGGFLDSSYVTPGLRGTEQTKKLVNFYSSEGNRVHSIDVTPAMKKSVMEGQPLFQRAEPEMIDHINHRKWYRTALPGAEAIQERGTFYASSYAEAEFYGRPIEEPFDVNVSNPLVGDEITIMQTLGIEPPDMINSIDDRFALDAKMKKAAQAQGYDAIAVLTEPAFDRYKTTGRMPRSIELNVLDDTHTMTQGNAQTVSQAIKAFGLTPVFEDAGFILADGRMLDFNRTSDDMRYHAEIAELWPDQFDQADLETTDVYAPAIDKFVNEAKAIRLSADYKETSLQIGGPLTEAQTRLLRRSIGNDVNHQLHVDIRRPDGTSLSLQGDASPTGFRQLMKQIREATGEQSTLYQFEGREALQQSADRRNTAAARLREIWDKLDATERTEARDWLLNKTLTDPLSGLETVVALGIDTKPDGWLEATSDLNGLTAINNTFGHEAGDQIITGIGRVAKTEIERVGGRAFRKGGDEFVYWFPDEATAKDALAAIDRQVAELEFEIGGKKRTGFSVSYGIGEDLAAADVQLYADKQRRIETGQRPPKGQRDTMPPSVRLVGEAPLGTMDNASSFRADSEWMDEGYRNHVQPLLDAMQDVAINKLQTERPLDGAMKDVSPAGQKMLRDYVSQVQSDMGAVKNSTIKWGESQRDFAMLNYQRRYGFDRHLESVAPYEFYYTRSLLTWAMRGLDKPTWYANYARIRNMQDKHERDISERLRGKFKIAAPWMPDWMGDALYIDPMQMLFAPANFLRPIETMRRDKNMQVIETERILQEMAADGSAQQDQVAAAAASQSGALWERASAEAAQRREAEISNPFDFMATMFGPAWYLSTPLNMMGIEVPGISKGDRNKVTNLPLTNTARAIETVTQGTWAEPIGQLIGLAGKPEQWARKKLNLPEFGEYGNYYIDRQLANMVAEGLITSDQAQTTMIERQGELFEQARQRVKMELAMKTPLAGTIYAATHEGAIAGTQAFLPSLFGSQLLPAGELEYRGLKGEWNEAWKKADNGDKDAINQFFDDHPEYEAYLAKGKEPQDRLRSFMIGNIWDAYMALGDTNRKAATAQLGDEFQRSFLDTETRDMESIPVETLTQWAQMLGTMIPRTEQTAPIIDVPQAQQPALNLYDPSVTAITDSFYTQRREKFPEYYMLEQGYYSLAKSDRAAYLLKFPKLDAYWKWRDLEYYKKYPVLKPILQGKVFKQVDTSTWPDGLEQFVVLYAATGKKLGKGATLAMQQVWLKEGQPYGDFQTWLDAQVVPAMLYQQPAAAGPIQ